MFAPDAQAAGTTRPVPAATIAPVIANAPPAPRYALVTQDAVPLRSGAKSGGTPLALLTQGELLELRGERLDYLQVYDPSRERGGYVRANAVRALTLAPDEAPELLALVRFLRDRTGSESLGLGLSAAYLKAAPAGGIHAEVFDAMGTMAERLAWRANVSATNAANAPVRPGEPSIAAQLEVAADLGVHFTSLERDGHVWLCYDGEAFSHVLALQPTPEQFARAALALTRHECIDDTTPPLQRWQIDRARADLLARVPVTALPPYVRNRVRMRQAGVLVGAGVRGQPSPGRRGRRGARRPARSGRQRRAVSRQRGARGAGRRRQGRARRRRSIDLDRCRDACRRLALGRGAGVRAGRDRACTSPAQPGQPGETCVLLLDGKHGAEHPLARRCTFGTVWTASARANAGSTALTLAVQPLADVARAVDVPRQRRRLDAAGAAAVDRGERRRLRRVRRLGAGTGQLLAAREVRDPVRGNRAGAQLRAAGWPHAGHREDGRCAVLAEGVQALPGSGLEARHGQPSLIGVYFTSLPIAKKWPPAMWCSERSESSTPSKCQRPSRKTRSSAQAATTSPRNRS